MAGQKKGSIKRGSKKRGSKTRVPRRKTKTKTLLRGGAVNDVTTWTAVVDDDGKFAVSQHGLKHEGVAGNTHGLLGNFLIDDNGIKALMPHLIAEDLYRMMEAQRTGGAAFFPAAGAAVGGDPTPTAAVPPAGVVCDLAAWQQIEHGGAANPVAANYTYTAITEATTATHDRLRSFTAILTSVPDPQKTGGVPAVAPDIPGGGQITFYQLP